MESQSPKYEEKTMNADFLQITQQIQGKLEHMTVERAADVLKTFLSEKGFEVSAMEPKCASSASASFKNGKIEVFYYSDLNMVFIKPDHESILFGE